MQPKYWYLPEDVRDVADSLENLAALTAFLTDSIAFRDRQHNFSEKSEVGICLFLGFIEDVLTRGNKILLKEGKI